MVAVRVRVAVQKVEVWKGGVVDSCQPPCDGDTLGDQ